MIDHSTTILLTSISAKKRLVAAFRKAFAQEQVDGRIIGIDCNPNVLAKEDCDLFVQCPRTDDPSYLGFIQEICLREGVQLIIPTRDGDCLFYANHRAALGATKVLAASFETAKICADKWLFHSFLLAHNFPSIPTANELPEKPTFPCVLKPRCGEASEDFHLVNDQAELSKHFDPQKMLIQEYVDAEELSIDYFADFDAKPISIVPRVRLQTKGGKAIVGKTVCDENSIAMARKLGTKLGLIGHNVLQCFRHSDGRLQWIEVNPRFGGASFLSFAAGASSPRNLVCMLTGKPLPKTVIEDGMLNFNENEIDIFILRSRNFPKAIVFDLDDTLYRENDYVESGFKAVAHYLQAESFTDDASEVFSFLQRSFLTNGRGRNFDELITHLQLQPTILETLVRVYRSHTPTIKIEPGVREFLLALRKRCSLGLLTNGWQEVQQQKVNALGLDEVFKIILYAQADGLEYAKPHKQGFLQCCNRLGVAPQDVLFVGDDYDCDIKGALQCGMRTFHVTSYMNAAERRSLKTLVG